MLRNKQLPWACRNPKPAAHTHIPADNKRTGLQFQKLFGNTAGQTWSQTTTSRDLKWSCITVWFAQAQTATDSWVCWKEKWNEPLHTIFPCPKHGNGQATWPRTRHTQDTDCLLHSSGCQNQHTHTRAVCYRRLLL